MMKLQTTKGLTALLWALVLALMPMNLMADENTPLEVTVLEQAGSFDGEKASNAFDGNPETKWCGGIRTPSNTNAFVRVLLDKNSKLDYYYLYTGNDINYENNDGKQQRNPKEWKLYAKVNLNDEWTLISHVTDAGLPTTVSTRSKNYKIDAAYQNIEYNFLKFEILQVEQGTIFEVGEICFINCAHEYEELSTICSFCGKIREHDHSYTNGVCVYKGCDSPYQQPEGKGTSASPYLIGNAGNLAWYRDLTRNGAQSSEYVKMTADIDMTAVCNETIGGWIGIINHGGIFDGDGHVLTNLYIDASYDYAGLFNANYGFIKNVGIESGTVKASAHFNVGAICGKNQRDVGRIGYIINCFNKANVVSPYDVNYPVPNVGGICAVNEGYIERCYNTGNISGLRQIGGICGYMYMGSITDCYNTGIISGSLEMGGICGCMHESSINKCYNVGQVISSRENLMKTNAIAGVVEKVGEKAFITNSYYLDGIIADENATAMTAEKFASGEVAWLLNGSVDDEGNWTAGKTDGSQAWYQKLGTDSYPTLQKTEGSTVFTDCMNNKSYNNASITHNFGELIQAKEPTCAEKGNKAYYFCSDCGKHFDEEGNEFAEGEWVLPLAHTFGSDDICTKCGNKKPLLLSFTIEESLGGFSGEGPENAIDDDTTNKWCGNFSEGNPYIVLKNDGKVNLFHYYLYTGNDIFSGGHNRNPKKWKLYAKEKASDEWTVISDVTDAQLPAEKSAPSNDYTIEERLQETYYKFFKFEIIGVEEGDIYEVGELCLMGYPCHHQYDGESVFCSICGDIKEHEHIYTDYIVTKEPTCTESGEKEHTCTRCEETETEEISPLGHTLDDALKCTVCGHDVGADCIIEYTATERLSNIEEGIAYDYEYGEEAVFDYTDKVPYPGFEDYENFGEELFGVPAIKHEYDEATGKGRIICNAPVTKLERFTYLRPERLTSITLPSTVTYISGDAFYDCSNLTSITLLAEYSDELKYDLELVRCNNLQEIIVPYNSYHKYVEACDLNGFYIWYGDEDGEGYYGDIKALFKSLLPLDDTKEFQTPAIVTKVDATLQRSFTNDGWYSLCVPFYVSVEDSPFSQVAAFDKLDGDTYKFKTVDIILPGMPYIVKVDAAVANPTFKNVFITTEAPASYGDFVGVYSPTELVAGCKVIGSGTTVNPANPGTMKGFRAYFPASAAGAKAMRFTVDDGETTSISRLDADSDSDVLYNLQGQRVNASHKGIVIKKGKKTLK